MTGGNIQRCENGIFYEIHYSHFVENQNERNAKIRHTERNRSIPDLLSSRKTCPEETIYQFGTLDEHASAEGFWLKSSQSSSRSSKPSLATMFMCWTGRCIWTKAHPISMSVMCSTARTSTARWHPSRKRHWKHWASTCPTRDKPLSRRNNRKITFDAACRKMLFEIAKRHGLELEEEAEYGNRKYLEKQDFILAKQKEQLAAQQSKLDELTLKVSDMETLLEDVSAAAYDKAVEVVTDVVRTETRKEDMRMIEDTKKWVLSPERKAPQATGVRRHIWTPCWTSFSRPCRPPLPPAREAAEAGSPAERQGAGQGESTGFRSATAEPLAGRTGTADHLPAKSQKHEVMFIEQRSQRRTHSPNR